MVFDILGEIAASAALCDKVELDAARGDVPDRVENAGYVGVRRELSTVAVVISQLVLYIIFI